MLTRHNPWDEFNQAFFGLSHLRRQMERWLEDGQPFGLELAGAAKLPPVALTETANDYVLRAELPGLSEKDITLNVNHKALTLSAKRTLAAPEGYGAHRNERRAFEYTRTFALETPVDNERATATLKDGVLTVTVAKAEAAKPRRLEIKLG